MTRMRRQWKWLTAPAISGTPPIPGTMSVPANLSLPATANRADRSRWRSDRMLIPKCSASTKALRPKAELATLQRINGGASDTEVKELIVMPTGMPRRSSVVTMATPVAKLPRAWR
jgi:hypothetical protein